jgi:hypothetical protein
MRLAILAAALLAAPLSAAAAPSLKTLTIPGTIEFVTIAKDVLDARFAIDPSMASGDGLFDDAARAPSFSTTSVTALVGRIDADLVGLRALPWRSWNVDRQIDWRWIYASAEDARRALVVERLYAHRPAAWLEPLSNDYINLVTYAPKRADLRARLTARVPAMIVEMNEVCSAPTARDVAIAAGVAEGLLVILKSERGAERDAAIAAVESYMAALKARKDLPEFAVIGRENYEWRLKNALLLPWSGTQLLALAQRELTEVDASLLELKPRLSTGTAAPTPEQTQLARDLTQLRLLGLYDAVVREDRAFLDRSNLLTVPAGVGPIVARPTPDAMIPLTGDGGSMNPPPPIGDSNVGYWNVEHFKPAWTQAERLDHALAALNHKTSGLGPYAVHEGVPGHHLQLSIARLNPNPLRSLLQDNAMVEGWALYAEGAFQAAGGLGPTAEAEANTLESWRFRVRRVFYDAHVERGDWSLQDGGDFKSAARRGRGTVDEDVLRTINWPTQLIGYFAGKMQILALKDDYRRKLGAAYTERKFHDALLAVGSVPLALVRAKLLDEPVPGIDRP